MRIRSLCIEQLISPIGHFFFYHELVVFCYFLNIEQTANCKYERRNILPRLASKWVGPPQSRVKLMQ